MNDSGNRHSRRWNCIRNHYSFIVLNTCIIVAVSLAYAINQTILKPRYVSTFLHWYLNDLLAMPLLLSFSNLWMLFCKKPQWLMVTGKRIAGLAGFAALFWETVSPLYTESTFDGNDLIAYFAGAAIYYCIVRFCGFKPVLWGAA